jgi:hypothetical protein
MILKNCKKIRTLRGSIDSEGQNKLQLILDDGRINDGLKVVKFQCWASSGNPTLGMDATLSLDIIPSASPKFDAGDSRQIAWVTGGYDNGIMTMSYRDIIDPEHIVNRDLYLYVDATAGVRINYLIVCEVYELSDDEAIISIIKETGQNSRD